MKSQVFWTVTCVVLSAQAREEKPEDANPRAAALEALAKTIASGDYKALRDQVIQHIAQINV